MSGPGALAIDGGTPVRTEVLPYTRHHITDDDIAAVAEALRADLLTTGPRTAVFEDALARFAGARTAVALSNGTAALHTALHGVGVGPGDEVIVPSLTFVATANAARYVGATPVFADIDPATLLIDPRSVAERITAKTRAIIGVDLAGQPADYGALKEIARGAKAHLLADACHALGGSDAAGKMCGSLADLNVFSFHPAKHVTTLEGGAVLLDDVDLAARMRIFRSHGLTIDQQTRNQRGFWHYEIAELGQNYRLSDVACSLGLSQLSRMDANIARRRAIARKYDEALTHLPGIRPVTTRAGVGHAYHLYIVRIEPSLLTRSRDAVMHALRAEGIGGTLHYPAVHLQPLYRTSPGARPCPHTEQAVEEIFTVPLYPSMSDRDADDVVAALDKVVRASLR